MRNLVLLIAMLLAGAAGWWGGAWSGRDAKAALALAEKAGDAAKAEHDKAQQALNQRLQTLTDTYQRETQALKEAQDQRSREMDTALARRDERLNELARAHTSKQAELRQLQQRLAQAPTPQARQEIVTVIERVQGEERVIQLEADGRLCQTVPVPADLLAAWRGGQP